MRLHELKIENFRKLKNCTIKFRDTTFLIGQNNAGKSSVFSALEYLHGGKSTDREDFSKEYSEENDDYVYADEIVLTGTYHNLPDEAKEWKGFKGRIIKVDEPLEGETSNSIIYKKVWSLKTQKPEVYILEYPREPKEEYAGCEKVSDLVGPDFTEEYLKEFFGDANFTKKLSAAAVKNMLADLPEYWNISEEEDAFWVKNPGGIPGNIISKLPEIVVIPAESCMEELTGSGGALHKLLSKLFEDVRAKSENYAHAQQYLNRLADELNPSDSTTDFGRLITGLNEMVGGLFPESAVHVNAALDVPDKSIKPVFNVEMESNVKTGVKYQGHGIIRATVFELLRFVQELINENADTRRTTLFCFEEPEIYLHPAAANQMRDTLYELAGPNCQIVATTHSPYMVDLGTDKSLSLTKFSYNDSYSETCSFNLETAFETLRAEEKQNLKMLLKVDDYISRIFFTKKSIFVEGDTEEVVVRETLKRLSKKDRALVIGNCEFLRARGKAVMISIAKYLNALEIDYLLMHDRDAGTPGAAAMNAPIVEQSGEDRRVMIEECIEDLLGYDAPSKDKPYAAYKHIDENWNDDFDSVPNDWKSTFIKLCSPYINHLN